MRGIFADRRSPIAYGYDAQVPVYFNQDPVLSVGGGGGFGGRRRRRRRRDSRRRDEHHADGGAQNRLSASTPTPPERLRTLATPARAGARRRRGGRRRAAAEAARAAAAAGASATPPKRRASSCVPVESDDMLLSGRPGRRQALVNRAQVVDAPLGQGHVVSFAIRPFWRWQTQGTFFLGFNTILNWNDLGGRTPQPQPPNPETPTPRPPPETPGVGPGAPPPRVWRRSAVSRELARRGAAVRMFEARTLGAGATQASAGILAPLHRGARSRPVVRAGDPLARHVRRVRARCLRRVGAERRIPPVRDARGRGRRGGGRPASRGRARRLTPRSGSIRRRSRAGGRARDVDRRRGARQGSRVCLGPGLDGRARLGRAAHGVQIEAAHRVTGIRVDPTARRSRPKTAPRGRQAPS